jgi:hypothetical protein
MIVPTFVDLQGFTVKNRFVVKEVAVLKKGTILSHYIFASPVPWKFLTRSEKSCASWLIAYHHGLRWNDGMVPYSVAKHLITTAVTEDDKDGATLVYVKGLEKRDWLLDMLECDNAIVETLDEHYEDVESLNNLDARNTIRCGKHAKNCALENVFKIYNWWSQRQKQL